MVVVVLAWVVLILLGWALVYWPHQPDGFVFGSSLDPTSRAGLLDAVYLSTVTLATLGFGDIVPAAASRTRSVVMPGPFPLLDCSMR